MDKFQFEDLKLRIARTGFSVTDQALAATVRTYIIGSAIKIPYYGYTLRVGQSFRWTFNLRKLTKAGVAASTIDICIGTAGTTADTARLSFAKPGGTATEDEGWVTVTATVRSIGAAGRMIGEFTMIHNLENTGHMTKPCCCVSVLSDAFDMTTEGLIVGLCITTGAADNVMIEQVLTEVR